VFPESQIKPVYDDSLFIIERNNGREEVYLGVKQIARVEIDLTLALAGIGNTNGDLRPIIQGKEALWEEYYALENAVTELLSSRKASGIGAFSPETSLQARQLRLRFFADAWIKMVDISNHCQPGRTIGAVMRDSLCTKPHEVSNITCFSDTDTQAEGKLAALIEEGWQPLKDGEFVTLVKVNAQEQVGQPTIHEVYYYCGHRIGEWVCCTSGAGGSSYIFDRVTAHEDLRELLKRALELSSELTATEIEE